MARRDFTNKEEIFDYILTLAGKNDTVLVRGSTAHGEIKSFSDFDVEIFGKEKKSPFYEIVFVDDQPVLLAIYFYRFELGGEVQIPNNVRVLQGGYTQGIEDKFNEEISEEIEKYHGEALINRKGQLMMDFYFKYMRSGDEEYLEMVNKRLRFEK